MAAIEAKNHISIILPVYNEERSVEELAQKIKQACAQFPCDVIFVNDGSTDGTLSKLLALAKIDSNVRVVNLKRNFGQTAALSAGFDHAKGDVIVTMDADGQNDPADIPVLIGKLNEGYDVVSGWRKDRKDALVTRKIPSWIANAIISCVTGVHLHDYGCTLKAYKRQILTDLQIAGEMHRFLPAWCAWQGGEITELPVRHHPRLHGESKYGLIRMFKVVIDLLTVKFFSGYLTKPNYLFSGLGFSFFTLGTLAGILAVADKFGPDRFPQFRIPLMLVALFFGLVSVFLVLMGVLAELLVRLYFQVRQQKPYRTADE